MGIREEIKAKPTTYKGVNFRSRLEAKWAAFFDVLGLEWEYEPTVELGDWIPDFRIRTKFCDVFAEVKPIRVKIPEYLEGEEFEGYPPYSYRSDFDSNCFVKARNHRNEIQVVLLGEEPDWPCMGCLLDPPESADYLWGDVHEELGWMMLRPIEWIAAGNIIQWRRPISDQAAPAYPPRS